VKRKGERTTEEKRRRGEEEKRRERENLVRCLVFRMAWRERVGCVFGVAVASQLAVLIRIGLRSMCDYPGFPSFLDLYGEIVGCFLMGIIASHWMTVRRSSVWAESLRVGLCETLASFSSWQQTASLALVGWIGTQGKPFEHVVSSVTYQIQGISIAYGAFLVGEWVGSLSPLGEEWREREGGEMEREKLLEEVGEGGGGGGGGGGVGGAWVLLLLPMGAFFSLNAIAIPVLVWQQDDVTLLTLPFVLAAVLLRKAFSYLDSPAPHYPYGTLLSNLVASLALSYVAVYTQQKECFLYREGGEFSLSVMRAVAVGLCGGLSSLSSVVLQMSLMDRVRAVRYCLFSVLVTQLALLATNGGYKWAWEGEWVPYCEL
jgi:fluoride ion exporter CrcB/FEX